MLGVGLVGFVGQQYINTGGSGGPAFSANFLSGFLPAGTNFTRASAANYWNSSGVRTAAPTNTARFDYNPQTLAIRGMLIEEARTNFLLNSLTPATQDVNLATGTYVVWMEGSGTVTTSANTAVGTGFGAASNATGLGTFGTFNTIVITTAGTVTFTIAGTVTAFQCELGTWPTSMITTTGAAATRAVDICTASSVSWASQAAGTLIFEFMMETPNITGNQYLYGFGDTTVNVLNLQGVSGNTLRSLLTVASATQYSLNSGGLSPLVVYKHAAAYQINDAIACLNATLTAAATPTALTPVTAFSIGCRINNANQSDAWIRNITYYNFRMSNTAIQAATS